MRIFIVSFVVFTVEAFTRMPFQRGNTSPFVTSGCSAHLRPTSSRLSIFKIDESISERFKVVQQNWDSIKATGLKNFVGDEFSDKFSSLEKSFVKEIMSAEKTVEKSLIAAEKAAEMAIAEDLKQGFATKNMVEAVDAAKALAEAASISAVADTNAISELSDAADGVRDAIKEAEKIVQIVVEKTQLVADKAAQEAAQKSEGFKYLKTLDSKMVTKLSDAADNVKESLKAAESVADAVGNVAAKDAMGLEKLDLTSEELIKSIEKVEAIAEQAVSSKVANSLGKAASSVIDELRKVEDVATNIAKVAQADASAIPSMETKATDVIGYIKAVEQAIKELSDDDPSSVENLKITALNAIEKIKTDEAAISAFTKAVVNDAETGLNAITVLESADTGLNKLVKAMEEVTNDGASLSNLNSQTESTTNSIKALESAAYENTDSAIKAAEEALTSSSIDIGSTINVGVESNIMDSSNLLILTSHVEHIAEKLAKILDASLSF